MKSQTTNPGNTSAGCRHRSAERIPRVPLEWNDSMSWRLPSGKALAEFALQAGFLAPVILSTPPPIQTKEAPGPRGSVRETR